MNHPASPDSPDDSPEVNPFWLGGTKKETSETDSDESIESPQSSDPAIIEEASEPPATPEESSALSSADDDSPDSVETPSDSPRAYSEWRAPVLENAPVETPGEAAFSAIAATKPPLSIETEAPSALEDWIEPLETAQIPPSREIGSIFSAPGGETYRIVRLVKNEAELTVYEAVDASDRKVWIREARSEAASLRLKREGEILSEMRSRMLPTFYGSFVCDGNACLATEPLEAERTLADALKESDPPISLTLSALSQIAYALKGLHQKGWVHLGIRPSILAMTRPVKLLDLSFAAKIGEKPSGTFYHAGYSPPESLTETPADPRADVYAVGALLYHAVNGRPIGETGPEMSAWSPPVPKAGVPQILRRCLGEPKDRYATMDELHQDLLRLTRRYQPAVIHSVVAATTIGLEPTRVANEDAYAFLIGSIETESGPSSWTAICLSDGMGGMAAGEFASEAAVKTAISQAASALSGRKSLAAEEQVEEAKRWMRSANLSVCDEMESRKARGGCTMICACLIERRLTLSHVGDCRAYRIRGEEIMPLTRDHSLVMALALQGVISKEEIRTHPDRSKITRSLGDRLPMPDYFTDTLEQETGSSVMELETGDLLLFCSDGLWEPIYESEMRDAARRLAPDLNATARALLRLALDRGAPDNATVVLARIDERSSTEEE